MVLSNQVIEIKNLAVDYFEYTRSGFFSLGKIKKIEAFNSVSLKINRGERVAIIGRNGSGKSTLLRSIAGMLRPASGEIETNGRILYLAGVDPGFDKELSGRENIRQLAIAYGIQSINILPFTESVNTFTGLEDAFERKYGGYSSGMKSKLGFGFISELRSDVLLIDETFGAGDREFKKRSRVKMNSMVNEIPTVVMCTHAMNLARDICERGLVMDNGQLVFDGPILEAIEFYKGITSGSINWIEFPYLKKEISKKGLSFNFDEEFKVKENIRLVIQDIRMKEFIFIEEIYAGENIFIKRNDLPDYLDCRFKVQQFRTDKWYDASKYIQLIETNTEEE